MPISFFFGCNSTVSSSDIYCATISTTNPSSVGSDTFDGVLASAPNIVRKIYQSYGHSTVSCLVCYQPKETSLYSLWPPVHPSKLLKAFGI